MNLHRRLVPDPSHPKHHKRLNILLIGFLANVALAVTWGPVFTALTLLGPLRHLSSQVLWVAVISYYANMMGQLATAAGLYSALVSHRASALAGENKESIKELQR